MRILWFTWKDKTHPHAGGAEVVASELAKRLVRDGHNIIFVTGAYKGAATEDQIDGYKVVRVGNRFTVYHNARVYYQKHLQGWADIVIDEVNTIPFFTKYYVHERSVLLVHQLCREIWFYQLPKYIGWLGYILEPLYLRTLADRKVITVSESTRDDLIRHGFRPENVYIISEGIQIDPLSSLEGVEKFKRPTLLSLGSVRPMKRTLDQIKAFELAKQKLPDLQLKVAGDTSGDYGRQVLEYIKASRYASDIEVLGRVSQDTKIELMRMSHLLLVTSIKEGWGLVVTEANSQGTPAVVYDVDGLRDSVIHKRTGYVVSSQEPVKLADSLLDILSDNQRYYRYREAAWLFSRTINFDKSYDQFKWSISGNV
ncbi:MAG TPA: glycosyltransferase family 4 protein [Candidatus Limnocylindrales bacterium]|nr:glycosyltransferase family 4 protein [Candidatus Limnocylindrales bacterium]